MESTAWLLKLFFYFTYNLMQFESRFLEYLVTTTCLLVSKCTSCVHLILGSWVLAYYLHHPVFRKSFLEEAPAANEVTQSVGQLLYPVLTVHMWALVPGI